MGQRADRSLGPGNPSTLPAGSLSLPNTSSGGIHSARRPGIRRDDCKESLFLQNKPRLKTPVYVECIYTYLCVSVCVCLRSCTCEGSHKKNRDNATQIIWGPEKLA